MTIRALYVLVNLERKFLARNTKGKFYLLYFRITNYFTQSKLKKIIGFPFRISYKIIFNNILGVDIPDTTKIGFGFCIYHGQGLVISSDTIIGDYVIVRQNTTIGNAKKDGGAPIIGNNVEIGANSVIIGEISIGDNSIIAAGSVVIKNVPPDCVVAGNPARIIKQNGVKYSENNF